MKNINKIFKNTILNAINYICNKPEKYNANNHGLNIQNMLIMFGRYTKNGKIIYKKE